MPTHGDQCVPFQGFDVAFIEDNGEVTVLFSSVHSCRTYSQDLRLYLEPQRALGGLQRLRGQHPSGVADGREYLQ